MIVETIWIMGTISVSIEKNCLNGNLPRFIMTRDVFYLDKNKRTVRKGLSQIVQVYLKLSVHVDI